MGSVLDFLHGQQGGNVEDFHLRYQRLIENIISAGVLDHDFQNIIDIPGQAMGFQHFGSRQQCAQEFFLPGTVMLGGADQNEKAAFQAQRPSIQNRRLMFDNASSAQLANPVPNRRLGRAGAPRNFLQR